MQQQLKLDVILSFPQNIERNFGVRFVDTSIEMSLMKCPIN